MANGRSCRVLSAALVVLGGCAAPLVDHPASVGPDTAPQRIVSLAPSLTETLFALGVGDRVVGVTRYCAHPPEVKGLPQVGGHLDPNYEAIVALQPDLVVLIPSSADARKRLQSLGLEVLQVDQSDVGDVLQSMTVLGRACGVADRGEVLHRSIEERMAEVTRMVADRPRPRTLVVVGHEIGASTVPSVWAAGPDTFYDDVLELAGGSNAVETGLALYPELSREGMTALDPDVVLDVIAAVESRNIDLALVRLGWNSMTELRAVRAGRVTVLADDVMVVPGPRLPLIVETVARALHPELDWGPR